MSTPNPIKPHTKDLGGGFVVRRLLPAAARHALADWLAGGTPMLSASEGRAHQRLLREFLGEHLTDARSLKAYAVWEGGRWG